MPKARPTVSFADILEAHRPQVGKTLKVDLIVSKVRAVDADVADQIRAAIDTHHHVSKPHLERYLAEFDFRYTNRKITDTARMRLLLGSLGNRRLTYRPLVGG